MTPVLLLMTLAAAMIGDIIFVVATGGGGFGDAPNLPILAGFVL